MIPSSYLFYPAVRILIEGRFDLDLRQSVSALDAKLVDVKAFLGSRRCSRGLGGTLIALGPVGFHRRLRRRLARRRLAGLVLGLCYGRSGAGGP